MGALSQLAGGLTGSSAPALRRPVFEIAIGSVSAKDWKDSLVSFQVESTLAPGVDSAEVVGQQTAALDDNAKLSAGYEDAAASPIFTGTVNAVRVNIRSANRIVAVNGGALLARLRINQGYEQRTAGEIVSDLASRASVDTDTIEDGVTYPYYVIDDGRSAWQHIAALARKNDFVAFFSGEGKLTFGTVASGAAVQTFTYGQDILTLEVLSASPVLGKVTAIGEGAAGTQGDDAWAWLLKDAAAVTSDAGTDDPARLLVDGALRSADAARQAAAGALAAVGRSKVRGRLTAPGAPAVTVGAIIAIAGAPQESMNGSAFVERVVHRYNKTTGFTTSISFSLSAGEGGLL